MSKRVVSLLLTLLLALSVCIPAFASTVEPADQPDVSEAAETEETAPAEGEPSVEEPAEETPAEEAPAEEASEPEGEPTEPAEETETTGPVSDEEEAEPAEESEALTGEEDGTSQEEINPIDRDGDYYVYWDQNTKTLTFQSTEPHQSDQWSGNNSHTFEKNYANGWHKYRNQVEHVVFNNTNRIVLNGAVFWKFEALIDVKVEGTGDVSFGADPSAMFQICTSLQSIDAEKFKVTETTTNISTMFNGCSSLKEINLSGWDVSKVTNMRSLFSGCSSLTSITGLDTWKPTQGTLETMDSMFRGCSSLTSINLGSWGSALYKVGSIESMFEGCSKLETITGIANWNTYNITDMKNAFKDCASLTSLDISGWNTSQGRVESDLFAGCVKLRELKVGKDFHTTGTVEYDESIHAESDDGVWIKDDYDTSSQTWDDDGLITLFEDGNANAAGTYYWAHKLTYDANDRSGDVPTDEKVYKFGDEATLAGQGDIQPSNNEVFVGWSTKQKEGAIKSKDEAAEVVEETVTFADKGITVYAVFAVDVNSNGTPDYDEYVTVTFDINGGDGSKESETEHQTTYTVKDLLPGSPLAMRIYYTLKWTKSWTKDGAEAAHPAILAGWTKEKWVAEEIILENDLDPDGAHHSRLLINRDEEKVPETDTTYYAVYAEDENGDQTMDYLENSLHVEYYANGGKRNNGTGWVDGIDGLIYRCNHHHVPFEDGVVLLEVEQGKVYVEREGAVLLGWSESVKDIIKSADAETAAGIVTKVTMPAKGNKKVYAVWAEDRNKNGIADYKETKVKITFDINGGNGSGDASHSTTYTVEALPGEDVDLPDFAHLHWSEAWEKDGEPADFEAILAGWADHPISDIILEDDVNDEAEVHAHISDQMIKRPHVTATTNITYYAVYAADENGDFEPDYVEFANQVEYYANGGKMVNGGSWVDGKNELFYRCGHHHVVGEEVTLLLVPRGQEMIERDGAVLIGWSEDHVVLVTSAAAEEDAGIISTYIMPSRNGRVYAVWAIDENGNGTPDYKETVTPEEPEPKPTPTSKPEPTPEATPSTKPEPTPEATPSTKPEPTPEATPSTKPTPTPTPNPEYGIIPDVPWYQYQPEDEGEYVPGPDEVTYSFPDVDPSAWYAGPVGWAAQSGVTAGYPDGNFHPDDTCTRAQIVTFLWKAAGTPMSVGTISFSDVEQGSFYYDAAVWAANSGIIAGYPDGNFHPDDPCTRAQIVAMLYRYANSPAVSGDSKFFDVDAGAYYYNAAIWAEQNGIVAGYPDGGFHPDDACTRAQIVTMLYNYIKG